MLLNKGLAQDREAFRALAEEAEPDGKRVSIQGPNRRGIRGNAGPVGGGDVLAHRRIIASERQTYAAVPRSTTTPVIIAGKAGRLYQPER
jgi:hypothetical protein